MLKYDRLQNHFRYNKQRRSCFVSGVMQKLAVSEDTIRRDIKELDTRDLLRAVRGGAHSIVQKNTTIATGKRRFGRKKDYRRKGFLSLIRNDQVLFLTEVPLFWN